MEGVPVEQAADAVAAENGGATEIPSPGAAKPPGTKGYGLKKWRRIRREAPKDAISNLDSIKMLKRGHGNDVDGKQQSDVSVSSTNAFVQSPGAAEGGLPGPISSYSLPINTTFSAGADSDNSEDRSSKSSTAASGPRHRHDALRAHGHQRDKHKVKNVGGRILGSGGPRFQAGKALAMPDPSKKARGESLKIEKENSLSSMESDSRSYTSVFIRATPFVNGDRPQSGRPLNHEVEDAYDEPVSEEQSAENHRADSSKNLSVSPDSSSDASKTKSKHHQLPGDCDPLVNSILMLQSAQAALEKEIQQFGDIGKGIHSFFEDTGENTISPAYFSSSGLEVTDNASDGWGSESYNLHLNDNIQKVEKQLGEADGKLKEKESKIVELEATIKSMKSPIEDIETMLQQQLKRSEELEAELENLFKQKFEAEITYIAMTQSAKEMSVLEEDHIKLIREQRSLVLELAQSSRIGSHVENKAFMQQDQLKEGILYKESTETKEVQKIQKRVFKFTKCLFIQLILLSLAFGLFFSQLSPKSAVVAPT